MRERKMIEVGQKLWFVPYEPHRNPPFEVEVVKVGRRYVTVSRWEGDTNLLKLEKDSLRQAGSAGSKAYVSRGAYDDWVACERAWSMLREAVCWSRPESVTMDRIMGALALLRGE